MANARPGQGLIAHWPFADDCEEQVGGLVTRNRGVELSGSGPRGESGAAVFSGDGAFLEAEDHPALHVGSGEFTVAAWVRAAADNGDVVGDLVSKFDPDTRRGLQLSIVTNSGVTSTAQSNYRNLHFGIDAGMDPEWTDRGRPGNAVFVTALTVAQGKLYAGTLETGADEMGRLWRYGDDGTWLDLGNPVGCNVVHTVAEFDGGLYAGFGRYIGQSSDLDETRNTTPGGQVYGLEPDGRWVYCGHPGAEDATPEEAQTAGFANHVHAKTPDEVASTGFSTGKADDVLALTTYQGRLYCTSNHRRGAFVYQGGEDWRYIGPDHRLLSFTVYRGRLYTLVNGGMVYRYEGGAEWSYCGRPEGSIQTYSAATHAGRLYVGTWPEGQVHRYEGGEAWVGVGSEGRVGFEREIMGMALYNGKVYLGSLPMANVWRMDGDQFTFVGNLDTTPTTLRRVWSMAVYRGELFAGTLPSGRVYSAAAGQLASWDQAFPDGWHQVTAVRDRTGLRLYVDGKQVATSPPPGTRAFDLSNDSPLRIGFGPHDCFRGRISDLRLYGRSLDTPEIERLATNG